MLPVLMCFFLSALNTVRILEWNMNMKERRLYNNTLKKNVKKKE